jgi:hypothetical protein
MKVFLKEGQKVVDARGNKYLTEKGDYVDLPVKPSRRREEADEPQSLRARAIRKAIARNRMSRNRIDEPVNEEEGLVGDSEVQTLRRGIRRPFRNRMDEPVVAGDVGSAPVYVDPISGDIVTEEDLLSEDEGDYLDGQTAPDPTPEPDVAVTDGVALRRRMAMRRRIDADSQTPNPIRRSYRR